MTKLFKGKKLYCNECPNLHFLYNVLKMICMLTWCRFHFNVKFVLCFVVTLVCIIQFRLDDPVFWDRVLLSQQCPAIGARGNNEGSEGRDSTSYPTSEPV